MRFKKEVFIWPSDGAISGWPSGIDGGQSEIGGAGLVIKPRFPTPTRKHVGDI